MFQRSRHRIALVLWLACLLSAGARATGQQIILHLRNGDRLTGFIISETTNHVVLTNAWITSLTLPQRDIVRREPLVPVAPAPTNAITAAATLPPVPALPKPAVLLGGEIQLGADLGFGERNRQLYTGRAKASFAYHRWRNLFDYSFSYGRSDGIISANRMDGLIKSDYDLTRRLYAYNQAVAGYDEIRKIDWRYEIGPGLGYHVVTRTNFLFKTEAGVNYQAQTFTDKTRTESFFYRFGEEAVWKVNGRLTLDEKFEFFPQVEDLGQYRFRFESNLRYALLNNVFFTLTVIDQYDTEPAAGVGPNDLQVRSTVGVKF